MCGFIIFSRVYKRIQTQNSECCSDSLLEMLQQAWDENAYRREGSVSLGKKYVEHPWPNKKKIKSATIFCSRLEFFLYVLVFILSSQHWRKNYAFEIMCIKNWIMLLLLLLVVVVVVGVERFSLCVSTRSYRSTQLTANLWSTFFFKKLSFCLKSH